MLELSNKSNKMLKYRMIMDSPSSKDLFHVKEKMLVVKVKHLKIKSNLISLLKNINPLGHDFLEEILLFLLFKSYNFFLIHNLLLVGIFQEQTINKGMLIKLICLKLMEHTFTLFPTVSCPLCSPIQSEMPE